MMKTRRFVQAVALGLIAGWTLCVAPPVLAGNPLSGAALENGCRNFANQAARNASEWIQRGCRQSMNLDLQIMNDDPGGHYRRCVGSVGTAIDTDLQDQERQLRACRGSSAGTGPATSTPGAGRQPTNPPSYGRPAHPSTPSGDAATGDLWELIVINSIDGSQSRQSYRIRSLSGRFTGQNVVAGNADLGGEFSGSGFRAAMTDRNGYRAQFFGRQVSPGRIEGTGYDNRDRGFSFTLVKR